MTKPFRFGIQLNAAADGATWRNLAGKIESLGYSTLYVPDHFGDQWGPIVALTVAAEATETLNVGCLVFDNDYRHPVVLAKEMATLDLVSEGRLEFGIGAGWMKSDYDESGMTYDRPGVRIDRLQEAVAIYKSLWAEGKANAAGTHYTVTNAQGHPTPHQRPHPKIVIGGGGKRVLSYAAREADIIGVNPNLAAGYVGPEVAESAKADRYRERIQWIRDAAGDRFDQIELQCLHFMVQVTDDRKTVLENTAPLFGMTPAEIDEVPIGLVGTVDEICDILHQRRDEYGFSYFVFHEAEIDALAPVVDRLAGT